MQYASISLTYSFIYFPTTITKRFIIFFCLIASHEFDSTKKNKNHSISVGYKSIWHLKYWRTGK